MAAPTVCTVGRGPFGPPTRLIVRVIQSQEIMMAWKSPKIVEVALGAEINSYACAEAKK